MNTLDTPIVIVCHTALMRERIIELQVNAHYIESLEPTTDYKVRIVAKHLQAGMREQRLVDVDIQGFWDRRREMIAKMASERETPPQNKHVR